MTTWSVRPRLADGLDVRLAGGVRTIRAFPDAALAEQLLLPIVLIVLGRAQRLWDGREGFERRARIRVISGDRGVTHVLANRVDRRQAERT